MKAFNISFLVMNLCMLDSITAKPVSLWDNIATTVNNYFCAPPLHRQIQSALNNHDYAIAKTMIPKAEKELDALLKELVHHESSSKVLAFLLSECPILVSQKGAALLLDAVLYDNFAAARDLFNYDLNIENVDELVSALFCFRNDDWNVSYHRSNKMRRLVYEKVPSITLTKKYNLRNFNGKKVSIKKLEQQIGSDMGLVTQLFREKNRCKI